MSALAAEEFYDYLYEPLVAPSNQADHRPWGVYGRISRKDRFEGAGAHVKIDDQLAQGCEYVESIDPGAQVIRFRDNKSAYLPDVVREDYNRMVAMLARGELKGIVGWHSDRITRQTVQQGMLWQAVEKSGAQLHTVKSGWIKDPTMWQMEGIMAERESRVKQHRAQDHHTRLAKAGKFVGGKRRFGYTPLMDAEVPAEADALRSIAKRVLAGESLASCVRWLEAEGLPGANGGTWTTSTLSQCLRHPQLAGLRTIGKPRADGTYRIVGKADWPAILKVSQHEALARKLGDPSRRTAVSTKSKYLLAGFATCAECGLVLRGRPGRKIKANAVYVCASGRHVYRRTEQVDGAVVEAVVARLERSDSAGAFADQDAEAREAALVAKRDALVAKRQRTTDKVSSGEYDEDYGADLAASIKRDLEKVQSELDAVRDARDVPLAVLDGMVGPEARRAWERLSESGNVDRQRAIVRLMCKSITLRGGGGSHTWDPQALLSVAFHRRPRAS